MSRFVVSTTYTSVGTVHTSFVDGIVVGCKNRGYREE